MFNLFDFIFPAKCLECGQEGGFVCAKCFDKIQLKKFQCCPICKMQINRGEVCEKCRKKSALSGLLVATSYEKNPLIRKMITQFKYKFSEELSEQLGKLLLQKLPTPNSQLKTIFVPVPLHFFRKWKRGFNQAELLSWQISKEAGSPLVNLLKRIKNTPQQAKLKRTERLQNLKGAFGINEKKLRAMRHELRATPPNLPQRRDRLLKGDFNKKLRTSNSGLPTVILVDDIASTLTTLEECAKILRQAGFKNVWGVVVARG